MVTLYRAGLVLGWVTVGGFESRSHHLGIYSTTQTNSAWPSFHVYAEWVLPMVVTTLLSKKQRFLCKGRATWADAMPQHNGVTWRLQRRPAVMADGWHWQADMTSFLPWKNLITDLTTVRLAHVSLEPSHQPVASARVAWPLQYVLDHDTGILT